MPQRLLHLEHLTAALGDAVTVDDVARAALAELLRVEGVVRGGIAISQGGGRELRFVSSDEDALSPLGVRWCRIDSLADVPLVETVRTGAAVYVPDEEDLARRFPSLAERQRRLGTRGMAALPLLVEDRPLGGLLVSFEEAQEFGSEQQAFLGAFAAQAAQALRRALAYQVQRSNSEQLQRSLMPNSLPELPGLGLGAHYRPGGANVDVGGDWYDVMALPDGSTAISLGDVMGKGVPAAIVMGEVRAATRAYAALDPDPSVVLARLDRLVSTSSSSDQVVTMLYGLVDPGRTSVRVAVAGHPPPLLVPAEGAPVVLDLDTGPALGVALDTGSWPTTTVPLEDNATLLFYSDGLVESRTQELFTGIATLRDLVEQLPSRRRNPREICARLSALMRSDDADDDVTLLAVTASAPWPSASQDLPADSSAARMARRFLASVLRDWEVHPDVLDAAQVCASELVTNAVIHSASPSTITVRRDEEYLLVTVHDQGTSGPIRMPDRVEADAISGRGLSLVDALCSAWSAEHSADGTTVWFEVPLTPGHDAPEAALDAELTSP
ncbi:MAG TPA: SpoIIE family protein phosphatase [Nocardioidaceae bacterium]